MSVGDTISSIGALPTIGYPAWTDELPPASPSEGDIWFKPSTSVTSFYVGGAWQATAGGGGAALPTPTVEGSVLLSDALNVWKATDKIDLGRY